MRQSGPRVDHTLQSSGMAVVFPIYDAHGNNVASLSRNGLGYQISNRRSFDAWGSVRLGSQTGDPTGRYCANLGHKQDDESGLVYMRARYYEPTSGRFVSEDPAMDGWNWFGYCRNNPLTFADPAGTRANDLTSTFGVVGWGFITMAMIICKYACDPQSIALAVGMTAVGVILCSMAAVIGSDDLGMSIGYGAVGSTLALGLSFASRELNMLSSMVAGNAAGSKTAASNAVTACFLYSVVCLVLLKSMDWDDTGLGVLSGIALPGPPL